MSCKKLDTVLFGAWNTYAISMMSVLEDCGMWNKDFTFQKFLGVTGIAARFCMDSRCSALPITDYDWLKENPLFMKRIGVTTDVFFAKATDEAFVSTQVTAINKIKQSINNNRAVTVWGVDTGEFGIINGYDDEDGVFFIKGIGTNNTDYSIPVLYNNLGKTFESAPVLYCEIPIAKHDIDWKQAYIDSLRIYSDEMKKDVCDSDRSYGIKAYDTIIDAIKNNRCDEFGLRYCIGVYYERKDAMFRYVSEIKELFDNKLFNDIVNAFREMANLWKRLMFDVFGQGTCGWNHLRQPIDKSMYGEIINVINILKEAEITTIQHVDDFAAKTLTPQVK